MEQDVRIQRVLVGILLSTHPRVSKNPQPQTFLPSWHQMSKFSKSAVSRFEFQIVVNCPLYDVTLFDSNTLWLLQNFWCTALLTFGCRTDDLFKVFTFQPLSCEI